MKMYLYVVTTSALKVHNVVFGEDILVRRQLIKLSFLMIKQTK